MKNNKNRNIILSSFNMYKGGSFSIYIALKKFITNDNKVLNITFSDSYELFSLSEIKILYPLKYLNFLYRLFIEQILIFIIASIKNSKKIIMLGNFPCFLWRGEQRILFHNLLYLYALNNPRKYSKKLFIESLFWSFLIRKVKPKIYVQTKFVEKMLKSHFKNNLHIENIGCPVKDFSIENDLKINTCPFKLKRFNTKNRIIFEEDKLHLFYPALFYPHKNHKLIFKCSDFFSKNNIKIHLTFNKKDIPNNKFNLKPFAFYDYLNDQEVNYIYSQTDGLIYTSLVESLGMPLLEIINYKKPIIAINLPYVNAIVSNCYFFRPNKTSICKTILRFKKDHSLKKVKIARSIININNKDFYHRLLY
tara:strand:- start:149 stop:1237 length:1089 start_codon:yes stop_codon:yes gene_type:complete